MPEIYVRVRHKSEVIMPAPIHNGIDFAAFHTIAHDPASENILIKSGTFKSAGKLGAFFAGKAASREAAEALFNAVQKEYGSTIANAIAPELRSSRVKGTPLSARTIRQVLDEAATYREGMTAANHAAVQAYATGNKTQGDTRNLDATLTPLFADLGLAPAEQANIREAVLQALTARAEDSDQLLSFEALKQISVSAIIDTVQDVYTDRLCAAHGLDAAQTAQMRELVHLASAHARIVPPGQVPPSPGKLCLDAEQGKLPGQQALLFAFGKVDHPDATVRDSMGFTTDANRVDMAVFCEVHLAGGAMGLNTLVMEKLPQIRQMQPEGPIGRDVLWQCCFNEPMPDSIAMVPPRQFDSAMVDRLMRTFSDLKPGDPMASYNGLMCLSYGMSMANSCEAVKRPTPLTMDSFIAMPQLYALSRLGDMAHSEDIMARDLNRRGTHLPLPGFSPVISFGAPGQPVQTVAIQDTSALNDAERAAFHSGAPSPISASLVQHCRELCNGNEIQARMVAMGLSQVGTLTTRSLSPLTVVDENGGPLVVSEHTPHHMDVRRQEDGSVTLRIYTPPNSPLDADYTFTIQPNGDSRMTSFSMKAADGDPVSAARRDPRISALPEFSQQTLFNAIHTLTRSGLPQEQLQTSIERLKNDFLGIRPEGYDIEAGMALFKENLTEGFLRPSQQKDVRDGIHVSFTLDARRGSVSRIGDVPTPQGAPAAFYTEQLKRIVPEQHHRFLPFVSMMASQAGMDSAQSWMPILSGLTRQEDTHLMDANIGASGMGVEHDLHIVPTENGLRIVTSYIQPYASIDAEDMDQFALVQKGRLTMNIDFTAEPEVHELDVPLRDGTEHRTIYVPQFTLEDGDTHFEPAQP